MIARTDAAQNPLLAPKMREVIVEVTSRCNLRCLYCAVSQPDYVGKDLQGDPEEILRGIVELAPREVQINGHGETTMLPEWVRISDVLARSGVPVTLTSNLAKEYEPREIEAFARLKRLTVSCDTSDPSLYARLRRGGRLEQIESNLRAIRAAARAKGGRGPEIAINCTFSHRVVAGLSELVRWAASYDLDAVALTNLELYPGLPGKIVLRHPAQVDPQGAQVAIREARKVARALGLAFYTMGGLDDDLERAARDAREGRVELVPFDETEHVPAAPGHVPAAPGHVPAAPRPPRPVPVDPNREATLAAPAAVAAAAAAPAVQPPVKPAREVPAGQTRNCLDPWEYAFVHADGGVSLCCWAPSIGNLRDASLADIVKGQQAQAMRTELLTGRLSTACRVCPARGLVPATKLRRRVARLVLPRGLVIRLAIKLERKLAQVPRRARKWARRIESVAQLVLRPRVSR